MADFPHFSFKARSKDNEWSPREERLPANRTNHSRLASLLGPVPESVDPQQRRHGNAQPLPPPPPPFLPSSHALTTPSSDESFQGNSPTASRPTSERDQNLFTIDKKPTSTRSIRNHKGHIERTIYGVLGAPSGVQVGMGRSRTLSMEISPARRLRFFTHGAVASSPERLHISRPSVTTKAPPTAAEYNARLRLDSTNLGVWMEFVREQPRLCTGTPHEIRSRQVAILERACQANPQSPDLLQMLLEFGSPLWPSQELMSRYQDAIRYFPSSSQLLFSFLSCARTIMDLDQLLLLHTEINQTILKRQMPTADRIHLFVLTAHTLQVAGYPGRAKALVWSQLQLVARWNQYDGVDTDWFGRLDAFAHWWDEWELTSFKPLMMPLPRRTPAIDKLRNDPERTHCEEWNLADSSPVPCSASVLDPWACVLFSDIAPHMFPLEPRDRDGLGQFLLSVLHLADFDCQTRHFGDSFLCHPFTLPRMATAGGTVSEEDVVQLDFQALRWYNAASPRFRGERLHAWQAHALCFISKDPIMSTIMPHTLAACLVGIGAADSALDPLVSLFTVLARSSRPDMFSLLEQEMKKEEPHHSSLLALGVSLIELFLHSGDISSCEQVASSLDLHFSLDYLVNESLPTWRRLSIDHDGFFEVSLHLLPLIYTATLALIRGSVPSVDLILGQLNVARDDLSLDSVSVFSFECARLATMSSFVWTMFQPPALRQQVLSATLHLPHCRLTWDMAAYLEKGARFRSRMSDATRRVHTTSPIPSLALLKYHFTRPGGLDVAGCRTVMESAVEGPWRLCPAVWDVYVSVELGIFQAQPTKANSRIFRTVCFRALQACPLSVDLSLRILALVRPLLSANELKTVIAALQRRHLVFVS